MPDKTDKSLSITVASVVAVLFGLATLKAGGTVLFISPEDGGKFVPFVLWFNFLAGFLYVTAGGGLWFQKRWAAWLSIVIATSTVVIYVVFGLHIFQGGEYKQDTVIAMALRSAIWAVIALLAFKKIQGRNIVRSS